MVRALPICNAKTTWMTQAKGNITVKQTHRSLRGCVQYWLESWARSTGKRQPILTRPFLESLESRQLLATSITEYSIVSNSTNPAATQLAVGPNDTLWLNQPAINAIGQFSLTNDDISNSVTIYSAVGGDPPALAVANGDLWFSLNTVGQFGMLTPGSSTIQVYGTQYYEHAYVPSVGITTLGTNLWTTVPGINGLEELSATAPNFPTPYEPLGDGANITGFNSEITSGPDGNLWFTEAGAIGVFSPTSDTVINLISLPTSGGTQMPSAIAPGPNNTIWFTETVPGTGTSAVGVISTTTQQFVTEFTTPTGSNPQGITSGPDGNMWFTESGAGKIGMIDVNSLTDPTQDTLGASFSIPTKGQTGGVLTNPNPQGIINANGSLWFADSSGAIGQVTLSTPDRFMVTTAPSSPVTAGAGINLVISDGQSASDVDSTFTGSVTATIYNSANVNEGTQTVTARNGVATFSGLTLDQAGSGYTIAVTSSAIGAPASITTNSFAVVPGTPTQLILTSPPPGSVTAGNAFGLTVKLEDQFDNVATNYSGTVNATLANNPGASTLGGNTTATVTSNGAPPGYATFTDLSINNPGSNYTLTLYISGLASTLTPGINVTGSSTGTGGSPPPPPAPTIIGETAVFTQKVNPKTHKKVGKPVFAGYMITFSTAMNQGTLANSANYVVDTVVPVKKTKKKPATIKLTPVRFSVTGETSNSVTLKPAGTPFASKAGQIAVTVGVESAAGAFLASTDTLSIAKGGKRITLA